MGKSKPETDIHGTKHWYNEKGKYHRENGPAIEFTNGSKFWIINGKLHREDGPAIERTDGSNKEEWWVNEKQVPQDLVKSLSKIKADLTVETKSSEGFVISKKDMLEIFKYFGIKI